MKHKGSYFQYKEQLEQDVYETYKRIQKEHLNRYGRISRSLLLRSVADSPARRFYTSEEQAARIIRRMLYYKHKFPKMIPLKREMYLEILSRVKARLKRKKNQPIQPLVERILAEPAPKFYISPYGIDKIICRLKKTNKSRYLQKGRPDLSVSGSPSVSSSSTSTDIKP